VEPEHIDHVQITVSEDIGIGTRAAFYEQTGVVRDMVQNHLLQLLCLHGHRTAGVLRRHVVAQ
jgi:glucose-6-phosphate 1-dehydrogenase